jgi:hypothetical protein
LEATLWIRHKPPGILLLLIAFPAFCFVVGEFIGSLFGFYHAVGVFVAVFAGLTLLGYVAVFAVEVSKKLREDGGSLLEAVASFFLTVPDPLSSLSKEEQARHDAIAQAVAYLGKLEAERAADAASLPREHDEPPLATNHQAPSGTARGET